jgi:hypothetical protein
VQPLIIVDGANVVGSVPDGWWRDRAGAARRLRDALTTVPGDGLPGHPPPVEVVLVLEGAAGPVADEPAPPGVRVVAAPRSGSGDDAMVDLVAAEPDRPRVVITADRGLRDRVTALGATVLGPTTLPYGPRR